MATERQIQANRANRQRWVGHTPEGLRRLRETAMRNQPWLCSTGPRSPEGKARASLNALKHGGRSAAAVAARTALAQILREIKAASESVTWKSPPV